MADYSPPPYSLRPHDLRGANLRYSLLAILHQHGGDRSVSELIEMLGRLGLTVGGSDPHKTVSDALRCELRKGRVLRPRWGHYRSVPRPDTTTRRHRDRLGMLIARAASGP